MNIEKFKKESPVSFVLITGKLFGITIMHEERKLDENRARYAGYVEVPYAYNDFVQFTKEQQKAICSAILGKSGWCVRIESCDPDAFFVTQEERELKITEQNIDSLKKALDRYEDDNSRANSDSIEDYVRKLKDSVLSHNAYLEKLMDVTSYSKSKKGWYLCRFILQDIAREIEADAQKILSITDND